MDKITFEFWVGADGIAAQIPELPGVITQGDSISECIEMLADAARGWLAVKVESGGEIDACAATHVNEWSQVMYHEKGHRISDRAAARWALEASRVWQERAQDAESALADIEARFDLLFEDADYWRSLYERVVAKRESMASDGDLALATSEATRLWFLVEQGRAILTSQGRK